jgi:acyl-homoserine lactone acylase PvdQ
MWFSVHGPIIAIQDHKAYAAASSYADVSNVSEAWYKLVYARNYSDAAYAMDTLAMFPQNVMVADTSGNIYFQRTGRVPKRAAGYDWTRPVDGSLLETHWTEMHPSSELLQLLNPEVGYMQNCNVPPDAMIPDSPFSIDDYPAYTRAIKRLADDDSVTTEDAMSIINDIKPFGADRWVEVLLRAHTYHGGQFSKNLNYVAAIKSIKAWDFALAHDSSAALKYFYWRKQMELDLSEKELRRALDGIDDWYASAEGRAQNAINLDELPLEAMLSSFINSVDSMQRIHGSIDAVYGDRFRVGRGDKSWPVGGGGESGTSTLRSMGYDELRKDGTQWGARGQTSTQVVVLSKPIKSWVYLPLGQSDRENSPHFDDQAEKLFSNRQMKSSWWMPEELKHNIKSRTRLNYPGLKGN